MWLSGKNKLYGLFYDNLDFMDKRVILFNLTSFGITDQ